MTDESRAEEHVKLVMEIFTYSKFQPTSRGELAANEVGKERLVFLTS